MADVFYEILKKNIIEEEKDKLHAKYKDYIHKDECPNCDVRLAMKIRQLKKANKSLQRNNQELRNQIEYYKMMR